MAISTEMGKYLDFPCEFGFRVLGSNRPELEESVTSVIVNDFAMELLRPFEKHTSRNGSYVSLKVTVRLESDSGSGTSTRPSERLPTYAASSSAGELP